MNGTTDLALRGPWSGTKKGRWDLTGRIPGISCTLLFLDVALIIICKVTCVPVQNERCSPEEGVDRAVPGREGGRHWAGLFSEPLWALQNWPETDDPGEADTTHTPSSAAWGGQRDPGAGAASLLDPPWWRDHVHIKILITIFNTPCIIITLLPNCIY